MNSWQNLAIRAAPFARVRNGNGDGSTADFGPAFTVSNRLAT